jgi:hypothetical protein
MVFTWSSSNEAINQQLRGYPGARPAINLGMLDAPVTIHVYGTDFLQQTSRVVEFVITRRSEPAPQITFFPPATVTYADQEVLVTALAEFSECGIPETALLFEWTQVDNGDERIPAGW